MSSRPVTDFVRHHFRHFNAATLVDAAAGYRAHLDQGGKMLLSLAGAMSTAELGLSLAEMIRQECVHAICCTGANLEEDLFNLVAHDYYERVPHYRDLTPQDEVDLLNRDLNRVTDTCIPEDEAMRRVEGALLDIWLGMERAGERRFPHEPFYDVLRSGALERHYQIDPKDSWLHAAMEKDLPVFVPGWEDSSAGNFFASHCLRGAIKNPQILCGGIEYFMRLAGWYSEECQRHAPGFYQIGGGIAGDFAICVVPMLIQDLKRPDVPVWGYFCQIGDSTTSYGSYSGAVPNEKITWGKLGVDTPRFLIESDATIVVPLMFALVLGQ